MTLDFSRCRDVWVQDTAKDAGGFWSPPPSHVRIGVEHLIRNPFFMLADEMGGMKTAQAIIAAQLLFERGDIDRVISIAPATVRSVWFDETLGELAKHLWLPSDITEFHAKSRTWFYGDRATPQRLQWIITNYDFVRSSARLTQLLAISGPKTLLILDEAHACKNYKAKQTKACLQLRHSCGRVWLLTGTPIAHNPLDMYAQGRIMDPSILGCASYFVARARYATITTRGGFPKVTGWKNLDDLQRRFAPYVLRRLKKDCLDLPPALPAVMLTATLTPETWKIYKEMRDDLCIWLDQNTVSTAQQAAVKVMRLAQITSGFVGGVEDANVSGVTTGIAPQLTHAVGREKLDIVIEWLTDMLALEPNLKLLIWTRFRAELSRLMTELAEKFPHVALGQIHGSQKREERELALRLLDPRTAPVGPAVLGGTTQTGSMGLSLVAAHHVIYMSDDWSLKTRLQADARTDRPGQTHSCWYGNVIAVGPQGQQTIDHVILRARLGKENVATFTTAAWRQALQRE